MSFFDKAKSLMFEDDKKADPKPKQAPANLAPRVPIAAGTQIAVGDTVGTGSPASPLDVATVEANIEAAIHSTAEFAPMIEFLKVFDSLKDVIGDEALRIKAAQKASGVDPATIIASIKSWSPTLSGEITKFESSFVASSVQALNDLNSDGMALTKQIDELTAKLGDLSQKRTDIGKQISEGDVSLEKAKIDFKAVVGRVDKRYTEFLAKLEQHLGA